MRGSAPLRVIPSHGGGCQGMRTPNRTESRDYDVAILGSGLGGSSLAIILARHGLRTLLLEKSRHPRFALGESVVPEFSFRAKLLSAAFDVPEFQLVSNFRSLSRRISSRTGIKRNFTFLYHQAASEHDARETCQFQAMTHPLGPDEHIYRADLDEWLTTQAVRYGADYHDMIEIESVAVGSGGVELVTDAGSMHARFVVDASGRRGMLARKVRDSSSSMATNTRTIFTHMTGVNRIRECLNLAGLKIPSPPDQGTLHHMFDGGWFWVIPFGNHRDATSELVSVGLTLDRTRYPDNDLPGAEEFAQFVQRFPTVERQFNGARATRPWVKTGRLQYQSRLHAGERWCLMPHAAGTVDALFSGGMAITLSGVHQVARALLAGQRAGAIESADFGALTRLNRANQEFLDRVVHGAYLSLRSHALFNAWFRVWAVANYHASLGLVRIWLKYRAGNQQVLEELQTAPYDGVLAGSQPRVRALVDAGYAVLSRHAAGEIDERSAEDELFDLLARQEWIPPQFHIAERRRRHLASFTLAPMIAMIMWGKRRAPADIREHYYDVPGVFFSEVGRFMVNEMRRGLGGSMRNLRDTVWAGGTA
jgi:FADH2 O2-dependent halogenase